MIGCKNGNVKLNEIDNDLSLALNNEIRANYEKIPNGYVQAEPIYSLGLYYLVRDYDKNTKYQFLLNDIIIKEFLCAYVKNDIKNILDEIIIFEQTGILSWNFWIGIDYYLKKYEYAIKNNLIEAEKYPI